MTAIQNNVLIVYGFCEKNNWSIKTEGIKILLQN